MTDQYGDSPTLAFIKSQGWLWKPVDSIRVELDTCCYCHKSGFGHLYFEIHPTSDSQAQRDGLFQCHRCGRSGNLTSLKKDLGFTITSTESRKDWAGKKVDPLPDVEACHQALLADEDALEYLLNGRGFSLDIIRDRKLGLTTTYFRGLGDVRAIVYPYLVQGNCVWAHYRSLPTMPLSESAVAKAFSCPSGYDSILYNGEVLHRTDLKEIVLVEGEADTIAALDKGVTDICGVPGANIKKAEWIDTLDQLNLERIYICYDMDKVGQKAAQTLASRIGLERCWKLTIPQGKDLNEWFAFGGGTLEQFNKLKEEAELFDVDGVLSTSNAVQEFVDELLEKGTVEPKYRTPWPSANSLVGFDEGDVIDILAPEKIGKGGLLTTPVLTCNGWKAMGELKLGDSLESIDGEESKVTGVFFRGRLPMYKVSFSDGRSTVTTSDHLWKVAGTTQWKRQEWRIYTTDAVANEYIYPGCRRNQQLYIPLVTGELGKANVPIDAWLMGALLGDGCLCGNEVTISSADDELVARITGLGYNVAYKGKYDYRLPNTINPGLLDSLKVLGIWEHRADSKFIPKAYLEADRSTRVKLLQGLMDTDGTAANKHGVISYCTISWQLANDVVYLVRSLGGIAKVGPAKKTSYRYKGELKVGQPAYIIVVRLPDRTEAFTLKRKLERVKPRKHQPRLTFESIECIGEHEAVCISVSHPSRLYITDDFIVTHNTTLGLNIMEHMVDTYGQDGIIICLEMTRAKMARKWISMIAGIEDNIPRSSEESMNLMGAFLSAVPKVQAKVAAREGDLYFCYPKYKSVEDIYNLMRDCIRRYGVKWIMIDNLQRLCDTTIGSKNRTQHLSEISKVTSQIAKDHKIQMLRILQPHRISQGKMVNTDNVDGSSQIGKDCDYMITIHRERLDQGSLEEFQAVGYVQGEGNFSPKMKLSVGLSRYSVGGYTTLWYDGARSLVRECTPEEISNIYKTGASGQVGYEAQLRSLGIKTRQPAVQEVPSEIRI